MTTDISIVIVNYNGRDHLGPCLNSIKDHADCSYEVIVVDNASTDGSIEYIRQHYPDVHLIVSDENCGFSAANNVGAKHASADIVLLLNNDTRLLTSLRPALNVFRSDPRVGVVGCKLFYENGNLQPSVGYDHTPCRLVLSWLGLDRLSFLPNVFRRIETSEKYYEDRHDDAAWVSGAFLMVRKSAWDELDGLDERYFMYVEEVDYCQRVRMRDYRISYMPEVQMVHLVGGGKPWIGEHAMLATMQSYITYTQKYYGRISVVMMRFALGTIMFLRSVLYKLIGKVRTSIIAREKARASRSAAMLLWFGPRS